MQLAVSSPPAAWRWTQESFETREELRNENARLRAGQRDLELRAMRYEALARENGELRGLAAALPPVAERWLPAEIVSIAAEQPAPAAAHQPRCRNGVFRGQAVLDDKGLIGQTTHVGPWSAEVILITDPEHAVPVRIERTGLRTIAVGAGDTSHAGAALSARQCRRQERRSVGDLGPGRGVSGGLSGGRVTEVHRDAVQPLAQVRASSARARRHATAK